MFRGSQHQPHDLPVRLTAVASQPASVRQRRHAPQAVCEGPACRLADMTHDVFGNTSSKPLSRSAPRSEPAE